MVYNDDLVWIGTKETIKNLKKSPIIPLVLSPNGSIYRQLALERLDEAHVKWRVVFSSRSYMSKIAATEAGVGITIMQKSFLPPGANMQIVTHLPMLGETHLYILKNKTNDVINYLVDLLTEHMGSSLN